MRIFVLALALVVLLLSSGVDAKSDADSADRKVEWAIALHGGAGKPPSGISAAEKKAYEHCLGEALKKGVGVLRKGGTALDAVEQVVRAMEDEPRLNAGKGSVFNIEGGHELHASIMDGKTLDCAGVASIDCIEHPVTLARTIMSKSNYVLMGGDGAEQFAIEHGFEKVEPSFFDTEFRKRRLEEARKKIRKKASIENDVEDLIGTVGCVAKDKNGNLAAATSTGGVAHRHFGRIGDTGIIGAGNYADNSTCAISCTGIGEYFIKHVVAYDVSAMMKYRGDSLEKAVNEVISKRLKKDTGGIIAVDRNGSILMLSNRGGMRRAAADSSGHFEVHFW